MLICLMVGVLYMIMAVLQLGVVTSFMPEPARPNQTPPFRVSVCAARTLNAPGQIPGHSVSLQ